MKLFSMLIGLAVLALCPAFSFEKTKAFEVTPKTGVAPLEVSLNAESLHQHAEIFIWNFGNGETLKTTNPKINYTFKNGGTFNVQLKYLKNKQDKLDKGKDGGSATIVVIPNTPPVADFTCEKMGIQQIHCESTSTDNEQELTNFKWTLDDGSSYTTKSFDHKFSRPIDVAIASHSLSLEVTDDNNQKNSISKNVEVDLEPLLQAPRGYFKVFMDGTKVNLHAFIARTQFNIKRAYYAVYGASTTPLKTIELSEFYANTISKTDLQNFGGYRIFMTVVDMRDQVFQTSIPFTLSEDTFQLQPHVEFRAFQSAPNNVSINLNPTFAFDESAVIRSFTVNFGDGIQQELTNDTLISHQYAEAGTYNISVTAKTSHNTQKTLTRAFTVTANDVGIIYPDPTFNYIIYDYAQNVSFYNEKSWTPNGAIISYLWDFGDGTSGVGETQAHFYAPGTYIVSLTVTDTAGLTNTQIQKITISAAGPDIVANIDCNQRQPFLDITQLCKINALDKYNEINRIRVVWGDGTVFTLATPFDTRQGIYFPQKKYNTEGTYPIRLIVNTLRGETKIHDTSITLKARPPIASIQCYPNNLLVFCDALGSYDPKGTQLIYEFSFGNGHLETNSTGVITYAYPEAALYDVSVKVTDATGLASTTITKVMAVKPPNQLPIPNFNCDSPEPLTLFCFDEGTFDPDGNVAIKKLSFDDGTFDFLNSPGASRHQFTTSGDHSVTLTVIDNDGGEVSLTKSFYVLTNSAPTATFECYSDNVFEIVCHSGSFDSDGIVVQKNWFINNIMTTFTGDSIQRIFRDATPVKVKLQVVDNNGAMSELEKDVIARDNLPPVAGAVCQSSGPLNLNCYSTSYDPENLGTLQYVWTLNNLVISNDQYFNAQVTSSGIMMVKLQVYDFYGAISEIDSPVFISENQFPVINLTCNNVGSTYRCESNASDPDGSVVEYKWIVEDKTYYGQNLQYEFKNGGEQKIEFFAKDNLGKASSSSLIVNVNRPVANFTCIKEPAYTIICDASGSEDLGGQSFSKYRFEYDDENLSIGEIGRYTFRNSGMHKVTLFAENTEGIESQKTSMINFDQEYLLPKPSFTFSIDKNKKVTFDASASLYQSRQVTVYKWIFGNGKTVETQAPVVFETYSSNDSFDVKLIVVDNENKMAEYNREIFVYNPEVNDPGENGKVDPLGVDTDRDGVRDDVQIAINQIYSGDDVLKNALMEMSKNYSLMITKIDNDLDIKDNLLKHAKIKKCIASLGLGQSELRILYDSYDLIYFNTEDRARYYFLIESIASNNVNFENTLSADNFCQNL